jgi:hypothetical protein
MRTLQIASALFAAMTKLRFVRPKKVKPTSCARDAAFKASPEGIGLTSSYERVPEWSRHLRQPFQRPKSQRKRRRK